VGQKGTNQGRMDKIGIERWKSWKEPEKERGQEA
jgi:hypothetical protein